MNQVSSTANKGLSMERPLCCLYNVVLKLQYALEHVIFVVCANSTLGIGEWGFTSFNLRIIISITSVVKFEYIDTM